MGEVATLAQAANPLTYWPVWGLFLLAGLLVGGTWSAYQNSSKAATVVLAVLAAAATLAAVTLLLRGMG